jgi:hypothetical protein
MNSKAGKSTYKNQLTTDKEQRLTAPTQKWQFSG